ncbi:MAG: AMIN domain-containing protein [bacterium]
MKPVLAVIVASALLLGPSAQPAEARPAEGSVTSLSIVPSSGKAELVIGVAGGLEVRDFTLRSPDRIVLDLSGASLGLGSSGYDHVSRGGISDVRFSNFRKNTVRVVLYLDGPRSYQVSRTDGEVRVAVTVPAGAQFAAWHIGDGDAPDANDAPVVEKKKTVTLAEKRPAGEPAAAPDRTIDRAVADNVRESRDVADTRPMRTNVQQQVQSPTQAAQQSQQRSQQPRITVIYQGSDIRDVLAAFASFSGRTIIPSSNVGTLKVDAEIKDQPWDVALQAILAAQGLAATEDANGIIIVDTQDRIAARAQTEPLSTRIVRLNYQRATQVGEQIRQRLLQCIPTEPAAGAGAANAPAAQPAGQPPRSSVSQSAPSSSSPVAAGSSAAPATCVGRGSVTFDEETNSVGITAPVSIVDDLVSLASTLDLRQPQVNIKGKIVLVNRTDLDALGIKYDLGSAQQFFSTIIQRNDTLGHPGNPNDPPRVLLGGNTVSAIANASGNVPGAALRLIYSTALGNFDFSTFLDALQEVNLLDVQAEPSVTIINNKTAELTSGVQVPFVPLVSSGGAGTALTGPVTVERVQTGVRLLVTPSVTNNRQILMHVEVTNSDVSFTNNGTLIDNNSTRNDVLVADGQTVVIGGLTQTSVRVTKSGIPLLVDLPFVGRLFGYTTRQEQRRDLLILITPHIIDEGQSPSEAVRR